MADGKICEEVKDPYDRGTRKSQYPIPDDSVAPKPANGVYSACCSGACDVSTDRVSKSKWERARDNQSNCRCSHALHGEASNRPSNRENFA